MKTQKQMYYEAVRKTGERDRLFLELLNHPTNPMTKADLEALIARRPEVYGRYTGFLAKFPPVTE